MLLGAALVLAGSAVLYWAITGIDPRTLISASGALRPGKLAGIILPGGTAPIQGPPSSAAGTAGVLAAINAVRVYVAGRYSGTRSVQVISVFRPGAIVAGTTSASEHAFGNAVDFRILGPTGAMDRGAMAEVYTLLRATPYCEACYNYQGGCTTSHTDHIHYAPLPCRAS